jgi:hypothetical protein
MHQLWQAAVHLARMEHKMQLQVQARWMRRPLALAQQMHQLWQVAVHLARMEHKMQLQVQAQCHPLLRQHQPMCQAAVVLAQIHLPVQSQIKAAFLSLP